MNTERKTAKILDICEGGIWLVCIKHLNGDPNPYRLYQKRYDHNLGYRQKQIAKYTDFMSVLSAIRSIYTSIEALK